MSRRNRRHATARRLEDRQDQQHTPDEASDEARLHVATRDATPEPTSPPQPTAVKVVLLFWGIPICLFVLIYVLRHCVNLW